MTRYHVVEPEVAGGWGKNTDFTRIPGQPVVIHKLHYQFDGWLGDELLESTPCYIVTDRLAFEIEAAKLTGVRFDEVDISKSEQFDKIYPDCKLPEFKWLKIEGMAARDDFGITPDLRLIVSSSALAVLKNVGISNALIRPVTTRS